MSTEARKEQLRNAQQKWRLDHPQENSTRSRDYRTQYRTAHRDQIALRTIEKKYGLTPEQFDDLKKKQEDRCAICGDPAPLSVDHDHQTNEVRGLLCRKCNWGLGQFRDDPALLLKAAEYLGR